MSRRISGLPPTSDLAPMTYLIQPTISDAESPRRQSSMPDSTTATQRFNDGQWIKVKSAEEILKTLDGTGTTAGLPMMPEMLAMCGRSFRVRVANKACVNADSVFIGGLSDTYVLQTDRRCDGSGHGGCQMGCKFYWHATWLEPSEKPASKQAAADTDEVVVKQLLQLANVDNSTRFRCQATELVNITTPSSPLQMRQYAKDFRSGVSATVIFKFLCRLVLKKVTRRNDSLAGPCKRTPSVDLKLKVGDRVKPKSIETIQQTLDGSGHNRGLWFDPDEMAPFCGKTLVVSRVVRRLIDEKTGELKTLKQPCIVLAESECSGVFRRFCSRGMLHFWREIWLEKVE